MTATFEGDLDLDGLGQRRSNGSLRSPGATGAGSAAPPLAPVEADPARRDAGRGGGQHAVARLLAAVWLLVTAWSVLALPARAELDAQVTADEPQYLLSAISLFEDRSLDISDELRTRRWRAFHQAPLPQQTRPLENGRRVSPHDPLLPVVLAVPVGVGGWIGGKAAMAVLSGALAAALVWVAVRRFDVAPRLAALVVVAFAAVPPLSVYGTQIYPEVPAALAVTGAIGALLGRRSARAVALAAVLLALLPWLSVKYVPAAAAGALWAVVVLLGERRPKAVLAVAATLAVSAVMLLGVHRGLYGGWTPYAAGDHFTGGEMTVSGNDPQLADRSVRLIGLLVDGRFGIAAWAPAFLLAVPALAALARRRPRGWSLLTVILMAGWLNATFVALTMHGWWWPGRQVVVVIPVLVLAVAWFVSVARQARWWVSCLVLASVAGVVTWLWLLRELLTGQRGLVTDFDQTAAPLYHLWQGVLPDGQLWAPRDQALVLVWVALVSLMAWAGWRCAPAGRPIGAAAARPERLVSHTTAPDDGGAAQNGGAPIRREKRPKRQATKLETER